MAMARPAPSSPQASERAPRRLLTPPPPSYTGRRRYRLGVRTDGSQPSDPGSIPGSATSPPQIALSPPRAVFCRARLLTGSLASRIPRRALHHGRARQGSPRLRRATERIATIATGIPRGRRIAGPFLWPLEGEADRGGESTAR